MADAGVEVMQDDRDALLSENVNRVHGRPTCDDAGRPLTTYLCDYHIGYQDGLDRMAEHVENAVTTARRMAGWKFDRKPACSCHDFDHLHGPCSCEGHQASALHPNGRFG